MINYYVFIVIRKAMMGRSRFSKNLQRAPDGERRTGNGKLNTSRSIAPNEMFL